MPNARHVEFPGDWNEDRGDRLFREGEVAILGRPRALIVLGLLLLCLILRVRAAMLHDVLGPDAVSYLQWATALENGDISAAFKYTGLNIYQPLLLGLKALPGDWLAAARCWSVVMATLAVLPIYGWIRRQFNETLAILGSGLYALHPDMVDDSALIVRDPTYWLLFALGLYTAWRAASELRFRWFGMFAIVFGLAIHLRTEGWLLLPVLILWVGFRFWRARGRAAVIIVVTLMAVSFGPLAGWLIYGQSFEGNKKEVSGNSRHLQRMSSTLERSKTLPVLTYLDGTMSLTACYVKGFGYVHLFLATVGAIHWRRRLLGRSKGPLLLFCLLSVGAVWVCFCLTHMDQRYTFPPVIVSLPAMAVGLCAMAAGLADAANRAGGQSRRGFSFWLVRLMIGSGVILLVMVVVSPRKLLHDQKEIGCWLRERFGPEQLIAVSLEEGRLVEFYSEASSVIRVPRDSPSGLHPGWRSVETSMPRAILIWIDWHLPGGRDACKHSIRKAKELGYREVPVEDLPDRCRQILVLARDRVE